MMELQTKLGHLLVIYIYVILDKFWSKSWTELMSDNGWKNLEPTCPTFVLTLSTSLEVRGVS